MARAMNGGEKRRLRAVMATDTEWERIGALTGAGGMDRSRYLSRVRPGGVVVDAPVLDDGPGVEEGHRP